MNESVKYWIELSSYDLETAKSMLTTKRYLYVGFMCHQTIEKILKAYFVAKKNDTPPFIHNLTKLIKLAGLDQDLSDEQRDILDTLEPLNIEARYPTYKEKILKSLNEDRCKEILTNTNELFYG